MAKNLEYFYATDEWNENISNTVKEMYKSNFDIDIDDYISSDGKVYTMWRKLIDDIYGRERKTIECASDIDWLLSENKNNCEFLRSAIDKYELYEIDVWIMASLTIAYLEHHPDNGIKYAAGETTDYIPEYNDKSSDSYIKDFRKHMKQFFRYERKYGQEPTDYVEWRRKRTDETIPKAPENNVDGKTFTKLSFVENHEYDRNAVSQALKKNRRDFYRVEKAYQSDEFIFVDDPYIESEYKGGWTTEDCLMFAKYVNPELVRRFLPLIERDEIYKYLEITKHNALVWQYLITAILVNTKEYKITALSPKERLRSSETASQHTRCVKIKLEHKPEWLSIEEIREYEDKDWYFFLSRRADEFLNAEFINKVNEKLKDLSLGIVYLYYNSGNKESSKISIYEKAIDSYIAIHDDNFMKATPARLDVLKADIRKVIQEGPVDIEPTEDYILKELSSRKIDINIFGDLSIDKMIVEYCMKSKNKKGKLQLNENDYSLLTRYAYLQEITIKLIQSRFME